MTALFTSVKRRDPAMSEQFSVESPESQTGGHPHDLLARLYREIGISAVAAALEVAYPLEGGTDAAPADYSWAPLGEHIAA